MYIDGEGESMEMWRTACRRRRGGEHADREAERVWEEDGNKEEEEDIANNSGHHQWNVNHMPDTTVDIFYQFSLLPNPNDPGGGMAILLTPEMREEPQGTDLGGVGAGKLLRVTGLGTSRAEILIQL